MKLLIVKSTKESKWGSCKVISSNLYSTYKNLDSRFQIEWIDLYEDLTTHEVESSKSHIVNLLEKIESFKPDRLVFVDHLPSPPKVLAYLSVMLNLYKLPPIVFHIYGDFTYFCRDWIYLNECLVGHPVTFVAASESQRRLLNYFLKSESPGLVEKMCFPVNSKEYFFNPEERSNFRSLMNIAEKDLVILYSGRVSLQKNVDLLINEFLKIKHTSRKVILWIAGAFDDVGADFIGYESYQGYMYSKIQNILDGMTKEEAERVHFFGFKNKTELRKIKSASDIFASFSLYHDEDYGMSPAEALATGIKSSLTDWGGYSSFASSDKWSCDILPVSITDFGHEVATGKFHDFVGACLEILDDNKSRAMRSENFLKEFSVEGNKKTLERIIEKKPANFEGFTWTLDQFANALNMNWQKTKFNKFLSPNSGNFYFSVYKNYISTYPPGKNL